MAVVMGIVALLVGLTIPAVNMLFNSFESESGAKSIISAALASARAIAAKEQRYAGIRFQKRYDPTNPDPLKNSQYIIFIINETDRNLTNNLANGFRAVVGIQPVKLPDSIGITDLNYNSTLGDGTADSDNEFRNTNVNYINILRDVTTFSIIFSPSGKLVSHRVRARNRDGETTGTESANPWGKSQDDIFNTLTRITNSVNPIGMFIQDDYPANGLDEEPSRNGFYIYETRKLTSADPFFRWTNYLQRVAQKPIYINPYTGTLIEQ
jgi:Tfp pilus assembly protein FimT